MVGGRRANVGRRPALSPKTGVLALRRSAKRRLMKPLIRATESLCRARLGLRLGLRGNLGLAGGALSANQFALLNRVRNTDIFFMGAFSAVTRLSKKSPEKKIPPPLPSRSAHV